MRAGEKDVRVEPLAAARSFVGVGVDTSEERLFEDAPALARAFAATREDVPDRVMPVVTASVLLGAGASGPGGGAVAGGPGGSGGGLVSFMGDEVVPDSRRVRELLATRPDLREVRVPAGTLVAVVPVRVGTQATLPLRVAAARKAFWEGWLPGSGYMAARELGFCDLELYHYRRRRFRRATKLVLELMFCVEPA